MIIRLSSSNIADHVNSEPARGRRTELYLLNYPSGTNNGKISSQTDAITGETVTYAYDSLNRLLSASGSGWNQSFGYDGFGNLVSKTGSNSPPLSIAVDSATNHILQVQNLFTMRGQRFGSRDSKTGASV